MTSVILDNNFGNNGLSIIDISGVDEHCKKVLLDKEGNIILGGYGGNYGEYFYILVKYDSNGVLDTNFGNNGIVKSNLNNLDNSRTEQHMSFDIDSNNNIVLVTTYDKYSNSSFDIILEKYNSNGVLDTTFGNNGIVTNDLSGVGEFAKSIILDSSDNILIGGYVVSNNAILIGDLPVLDNIDFLLVKYNSNGSLDLSFGSNGFVTSDFLSDEEGTCFAIDSSDNIIMAGHIIKDLSNNKDLVIAKYNHNGELDLSFGSNGKTTIDFSTIDSNINDLLIDSNNNIIVGGYSVTSSNKSIFSLAKLNSNGELDANFGTNGLVSKTIRDENKINSIVLDKNNKIIIAGEIKSTNGNYDIVLLRYDNNGVLDTTFGSNGYIFTDINNKDDLASSIVLDSNNRIIVAGNTVNETIDFVLLRYITADESSESNNNEINTFVTNIMPVKGQFSQNGGGFSLMRRIFQNTPKNNHENHKRAKNSLYQDNSLYLIKRKSKAIGKEMYNSNISFNGTPTNDMKNALKRMRSSGTIPPQKH